MINKTKKEIYEIGPWLILIGILLLLLFRCTKGFDPTDEAYYYAVAKRFCIGDKPFVDEWYPAQFFAVLLCPFYYIFHMINPSGDGIILAGRITYLLIACGVSLFLLIHSHANRWVSLTIAAVYLFCARQNVMGLSYYKLYPTFAILSFYLLQAGRKQSLMPILKKRLYIVLSGGFIAMAVLCMPFLAPFVFVYWCWLLKKDGREMWSYAAGILIVAIIYLQFLLRNSSIEVVLDNLQYVINNPDYANLSWKVKLWDTVLSVGRECIAGLPGIIYLIIQVLRKKSISIDLFWGLLVVSMILMCITGYGMERPGAIYNQFFFAGLPVFLEDALQKRTDDTGRKLYMIGFVLAAAFWMGSDTRATCLCVGYSVSIIGLLLILYRNVKTCQNTLHYVRVKRYFLIICLLFTVSAGYVRIFGPVYRDASLNKLNCQITSGPAAGLYTEGSDAAQYNTIIAMLNKLQKENPDRQNKVLYSKFLPWAYLYTDYQYATPTPWRTAMEDSQLETYERVHPDKMPDIVVIFNEDIGPTNGLNGGGYMNAGNILSGYLWEYMGKENYQKYEADDGIIFIR